MNGEFNWWLLIVGLVIGAALVWLVLADSARRDADVEDEEIPMEAAWISATLRIDDDDVEPQMVDRILRLHRAYLTSPPPDGPVDTPVDTRLAPAEPEPEPGPRPRRRAAPPAPPAE